VLKRNDKPLARRCAPDRSGVGHGPPQTARNNADRAHMERWLNGELDALLAAADRKRAAEVTAALNDPAGLRRLVHQQLEERRRAWLLSDDAEMEAAKQRGDLGPFRNKYPSLAAADVLKLPKQAGKGHKRNKGRRPPSDFETDLTEAVWDAAKIRAIWQQEYGRPPRGYGAPEDIAGRRYGVSGEHVRSWAKNRRCPKIPAELLRRAP
jgi:hypothetical protein